MDSVPGNFSQMLNAALLLTVILAAVAIGIALLLMFLMVWRTWQHFRVQRFDAVSFKIRTGPDCRSSCARAACSIAASNE